MIIECNSCGLKFATADLHLWDHVLMACSVPCFHDLVSENPETIIHLPKMVSIFYDGYNIKEDKNRFVDSTYSEVY